MSDLFHRFQILLLVSLILFFESLVFDAILVQYALRSLQQLIEVLPFLFGFGVVYCWFIEINDVELRPDGWRKIRFLLLVGTHDWLHFESIVNDVGDVGELLWFEALDVLICSWTRPLAFVVRDVVAVRRLHQGVLRFLALLAPIEAIELALVLAARRLPQSVVSLAWSLHRSILALALPGEHRMIFFYCLSQTAIDHLIVDLEFHVLELAHEVLPIQAFPG